MTLTFRIIASIFAAIATILFKYAHNLWGTISILLTILSLVAALFANKHESKTKNHTEKQRELFKAALDIIKARSRITLDIINEFKVVFAEYKYFIKPEQEKTLAILISDLQELRIYSEERKGNVTPEERKSFVAKERKLLDKIESMTSTIEKYLRKIT